MKFRTWLQGAGVAALILFPFYRSLLDMPGDLRMHTPVSFTSLALSLVANLLMVSLIFLILGTWVRPMPTFRLVIPALLFASLTEMIHIARAGWESTQLWIAVVSAVLGLSVVFRWRWNRGNELLLRAAGAVLTGLGFFCVLVVFQLGHLALWHQSPNSLRQNDPATAVRVRRPRVVWILFDELSYRQTFGDRFPNLQLPNFDSLRQSSTLFTDVQPIVNKTEKAIPSMLLGQKIVRVNYTPQNRLEVGGETGPLYPFDSTQTPFALARQNGLTTGVAGWYNPYCGMLKPYLNQCFWTNEFLGPSRFQRRKRFLRNVLYPWSLYGLVVGHPWQMLSEKYRVRAYETLLRPDAGQDDGNRILVYQALMDSARQMLGPSGPDFVFLHLPIPHPSGFYDRKTRKLDVSVEYSYIDNLALADKALGELLTILQRSPQWEDTSVVICGDHSWRVYLWRNSPVWTAEGEAATHGKFDPRPVLMVHLAGQTTASTVSTPFPLLRVHDILDDLIVGKQPAYTSLQNSESLTGQ